MKTYINILVEGVIQLLKLLAVEDGNVTLNIIAGFKKDTRQEITNSLFLLYRLAILDHFRKLDEMGSVLHDSEKVLQEEIIRAENLEYYFIFYNRFAVYCMDVFNFEKTGEILYKVTEVFTDYKVVLSSLPFMEIDDECIISDQYARLLGYKSTVSTSHATAKEKKHYL